MHFGPSTLILRFILSPRELLEGNSLEIVLETVAGEHAFSVPQILLALATLIKLGLGLPLFDLRFSGSRRGWPLLVVIWP